MPGVATRGPVPSRSEERSRGKRDVERTQGPDTRIDEETARAAGIDLAPAAPPASDKWSERVVAMYESLATSPGVMFMYAADWELAWQMLDVWDRQLKPQFVGMETVTDEDGRTTQSAVWAVKPPNGAQVASLVAALGKMGVTEESRRRMGFEAPALQRALDLQAAAAADDGSVVRTRDELAARRLGNHDTLL